MKISCFKTVLFNLMVPVVSGTMLFSCAKPSGPNYDYSLAWQGKGLVVYSPDYEKYGDDSIDLEQSLPTYLNSENVNEMIAQDVTFTLSHWYKGNPELMWEYSSGVYCPVKKKFTYTICIKEATHNFMVSQLEIINMTYHAITTDGVGDIHIAFLPKNIQYVNKTFVIEPAFWLDSEWQINLSTYDEEGAFNRKYEFSWKTFLPDTQDILLDYLQYTVIYPHFYEGIEVQ